jgi:hypothetical protein
MSCGSLSSTQVCVECVCGSLSTLLHIYTVYTHIYTHHCILHIYTHKCSLDDRVLLRYVYVYVIYCILEEKPAARREGLLFGAGVCVCVCERESESERQYSIVEEKGFSSKPDCVL